MSDPFLHEELALTEQQIAEAEELLVHQAEVIKCLAADGHDTTKAEDQLQVPFTYISTQDVSREANLKSKYDVILFAPVGRGSQAIIPIRERTRFPARLLEALSNLEFISQTGNHAYHIDVEAATRALLGRPRRLAGAAE